VEADEIADAASGLGFSGLSFRSEQETLEDLARGVRQLSREAT
jgi:hypothetical protein